MSYEGHIYEEPRANIEGNMKKYEFFAKKLYSKEEEALNSSKSQGLYRGEGIGIFPSPRA